MVKYISLIVFLISFSAVEAAPTMQKKQLGFKDWLGSRPKSTFNLLDPSRLTIQHNLSFGISSGSGGSIMQNLYATKLGYKLSDPVTLTFLLGFQNSQFSGNRALPGDFNSFFGGFALDYRPRRDIHLHFEMLQSPGYLYLTNPYFDYVSPTLK